MDWRRIIDAANGRPQSLAWFVRRGTDADVAALATLLLLEEAPHPAASLVAAAATWRGNSAPPIQAALAPQIDAALAAWRADPQVLGGAFGVAKQEKLAGDVAGMVGALRDRPAALRDAVAIVRRCGHSVAVERCIDALGGDGWRSLDDDLRAALAAKARAAALGRVWTALDETQRAAAAQATVSDSVGAALLVRAIGAAAWPATDPALRKRLIDAVVRSPLWSPATAPAWPGMTDDERARLATTVIERGDSRTAVRLLDALGVAGRGALTADLRAVLESRARDVDSWRVLAWRAADAGWSALTDDERAAMLAAAEEQPRRVADLLRAVGAAGWNVMRADEQARMAVVVRRTSDAFFRCPPALWTALAGDDPPPATDMPADAPLSWRAEDADADLGGLPPSHQALVLALAPWRPEEAAKDSDRVQRLRVAWGAMTADDRAALATAHPSVLSAVAAAAHMCGGAAAAVDAVGATVARVASATGGAAAKRAVAAVLRTPDRWRAWMIAFAPTDNDPPDVGKAWRDAARRGSIADVALCARLAASPRESGPRHPRARAGR